MARVTTSLSADDLSRLIDGLQETPHIDQDEPDQAHTAQLLQRLLCLFDQVMKEELQPYENAGDGHTLEEIADLVFG